MNTRDDTKQMSLPPLRTPLAGLSAQITEGIIMRRAMTLAQVQALYVPCLHTPEEIGEQRFKQHLKSRQEATRQVLDKLYRHGYIRRTQLPTDALGRNPWLYGAPTWKALVEVALHHASHPEETGTNDMNWKRQPDTLAGKYGWSKTDKILTTGVDTLQHFIREIDVNVILTLACRQGDYQIATWDSDLQVRRRHQDVRVTYTLPEVAEPMTTAVIPDGWYVIRQLSTGASAKFFVELDLGSQTIRSKQSANELRRKKSWSHKFPALVNFFKHNHFEDLYGQGSTGTVVTITTSQLRMQHLQTLCEEVGGGANFLFTFFDIFTPKNVFTQPIFQQAGNRTWVRLFDDSKTPE